MKLFVCAPSMIAIALAFTTSTVLAAPNSGSQIQLHQLATQVESNVREVVKTSYQIGDPAENYASQAIASWESFLEIAQQFKNVTESYDANAWDNTFIDLDRDYQSAKQWVQGLPGSAAMASEIATIDSSMQYISAMYASPATPISAPTHEPAPTPVVNPPLPVPPNSVFPPLPNPPATQPPLPNPPGNHLPPLPNPPTSPFPTQPTPVHPLPTQPFPGNPGPVGPIGPVGPMFPQPGINPWFNQLFQLANLLAQETYSVRALAHAQYPFPAYYQMNALNNIDRLHLASVNLLNVLQQTGNPGYAANALQQVRGELLWLNQTLIGAGMTFPVISGLNQANATFEGIVKTYWQAGWPLPL